MFARNLLSLFAASLLLASTAMAQETFSLLKTSFSVADNAAVKLAVADADVTISTGATSDIQVEIHVRAADREQAVNHFEAQNYSVEMPDGIVTILDEPERRTRNYTRRSPQVQIAVTTPVSVDLRLRTADGDLVVGKVEGDVLIKTSDGDIVADHLTGTMFEARTSDGDIVLESLDFKNVVIQTSDGDVVVRHADAEEVTAHTSDGDIHFGQLNGIADIRTSDGDIHMGALASSAGQIRTSDGDIVLEQVNGNLTATTVDGNLVVDLVGPEAVTLRTSDGDVVVSIPASHGADLNLRGSDVRLDCCGSFEGQRQKERIEGRVNGGGAPLRISSSDGSVVLRES